MALMSCHWCRRGVGPRATICVHCGCPSPTDYGKHRGWEQLAKGLKPLPVEAPEYRVGCRGCGETLSCKVHYFEGKQRWRFWNKMCSRCGEPTPTLKGRCQWGGCRKPGGLNWDVSGWQWRCEAHTTMHCDTCGWWGVQMNHTHTIFASVYAGGYSPERIWCKDRIACFHVAKRSKLREIERQFKPVRKKVAVAPAVASEVADPWPAAEWLMLGVIVALAVLGL